MNTNAARLGLREFDYWKDESQGKKLLSSISDLATFTALDRPGPLDAFVTRLDGGKHNMLTEFARRARGLPATEALPVFDELIPETHSILVYQEQVQKIYQKLTDCTGSEAEKFRRLVAKKKAAELNKAYEQFIVKAGSKVGEETAKKIWSQIQTFSAYGFCIYGEQEVSTTVGFVPIKDLTVNHKVHYWDNDLQEIKQEHPTALFDQGQKEVFRVVLEDGSKVEATEDHRFLYQGEWISLGALAFYGEMEVFRSSKMKKQPIKSVQSLGIQKVYDIEMPSKHNFILKGGTVAHNCKAHSFSYVTISYASAFLKYHFPLIWWCSVLRNASKNEITEKFYQHCKQWLLPPDIQRSDEKFTIVDGKIISPLSYINGVGEEAHKELVAGRPFTSIEDFCAKIVATKKKKMSQNKDGKWRMGTSALNAGVVQKLIIAGVMDPLFDAGNDLITKLERYHKVFADATNAMAKEISVLTGAKAKTVKPKVVKGNILKLSALNRYQVHKDLMPIGSGKNLIAVLADISIDGVLEHKLKHSSYQYRPSNPDTMQILRKQTSAKAFMSASGKLEKRDVINFADASLLKLIVDDKNTPREPLRVAIAAYVVNDENIVNKKNGSTARKLTLDIEGQQFQVVRWPRGEAKKVIGFQEGLKGAVIIAILYQHSEKHAFNLDGLVVVENPVSLSEKDDESLDDSKSAA